jgi:hypothetical protein
MTEELDAILRRVAAGELTPEDAEPLVEAATGKTSGRDHDAPAEAEPAKADQPVRRTVRLEVLENGRAVTTLRIPMSWASLANVVPGLSRLQSDRIREAIRSGSVGPILEVQDEDGDGVIISTE